jgi:hypothetical protein
MLSRQGRESYKPVIEGEGRQETRMKRKKKRRKKRSRGQKWKTSKKPK